MKICHIITRMIIGGAQENTLYTCEGLIAKGHDVTLITGPTTGPEGALLSRSTPPGLKIIEIPELLRQLSPLNDWRAYRKIYEICKHEKYDVVHTHASKAGIVGRIAAKKAGVPFVVHTVHGQAFFEGQNPLLNKAYVFAERMAARYSDRIYAVAQAMIDQCVNAKVAPRDKYKVVYSGMDLDAFFNAKPETALMAKLGIDGSTPVVGTVARLFELKGHDMILKAAPKIIKAIPNVKFMFVGDGILRQSLEEQIKDAGITDNFIFVGLVPPTEVCRYTALMNVMAHLSLREGLPRACVQALASRVPVVAYPLDGTPEVVLDGKTGILCPPKDADAVADAIIKLLKSPELCKKMGQLGQDNVRKLFDWHKMVDILEEEYIKHQRS